MWQAARTVEECDKILTAPGQLLELEEVEIAGVKYRSYKNLPKSVRAEFLATEVFGDKDYLVYQNERYTYAEAHQKVKELTHLFVDKYGCKVGDRIAICARNSPEFVLIFWATQVIGVAIVAVNAWLEPSTMEYCITSTDNTLVILDIERSEVLKGAEPIAAMVKTGVKGILVLRSHEKHGKIPLGMLRLEDELKPYAGVKTYPEADVKFEDISTIFFTSGTTGLPKGVVGTHRQFLTNGFNSILPTLRAILRRGETPPAPDPNAPQKGVLLSTPLFHATGVHSNLQVSTMLGLKIGLLYKWDVNEAVEMIIKERFTSAGGIPFMAQALLADKRLQPETCALEGLGFGGGPASRTLAPEIAKRFKSTSAPAQGYGATELSSAAVIFAGEDFLARPTSCGLPCLTIDIKILDEAGNVLGRGDGPDSAGVGEIYLRGVNRTNGYWKNPKATAEAFLPDGWYRTGDIGYQDAEGFVYILDRAKDIIIRGGENIASAVVENALYTDGRLADVAVVAMKCDVWGESVGAVVTTKDEFHGKVTDAELMAHAAKHIPKHMVPVFIDIRTEELPRNGVGKTMKKELREELTGLWNESKKVKAKL